MPNGGPTSGTSPSTPAKKMSLDLFFPTPIFYTDLHDTAAINAQITALIYQWRVDDPNGELRTNEPSSGGWHSRTQMHRRREYDPLTAQIFEFIHGVFTQQGYDADFEPACDSMWANINPRHASNRYHTHPHALWSGVYYVQTPPECGLLYFADPRAQTQVMPPYYDLQRRPAHTWHEVHYQPVEGRLLVFPAWLPHAVQPNLTTLPGARGDRISISFNFHQRRKQAVVPSDGQDDGQDDSQDDGHVDAMTHNKAGTESSAGANTTAVRGNVIVRADLPT